MSASTYDEALRRLLAHEGGYVNHPSDPGGPTNFGITLADYRRYRKPDATAADVRAMKVGDANAIYRAKYWNAQRCDQLPAGVDYSIFDYGVNSGTGRSGKVLRRVLGLPDKTSLVNDEVLRAVAKRDPKALVAAINDERLAFLKHLKTWPVFGAGWSRRVAEVRSVSLRMAAQTRPVPSVVIGHRSRAGQRSRAGARSRQEGDRRHRHRGARRGRRQSLGLDRCASLGDRRDCRAASRWRSADRSTSSTGGTSAPRKPPFPKPLSFPNSLPDRRASC